MGVTNGTCADRQFHKIQGRGSLSELPRAAQHPTAAAKLSLELETVSRKNPRAASLVFHGVDQFTWRGGEQAWGPLKAQHKPALRALCRARPCWSYCKDSKMQGKVLLLFSFVRKMSPYLLVWERGLDHGSLKAVHPLELCLLPQGLEDLH